MKSNEVFGIYDITELYGEGWINAIINVMDKVNMVLGTEYFLERDGYQIEELAHSLHIKFYEGGDIAEAESEE